uniref:Uncharacterized protein n=1 Tax=Knipowitschia caucasica TaxID=637954 RepID=A0AAV2LZG4_KNICA
MSSIHSDSVSEVHNVPLHVLIRPFPPELDEHKVQSLMETIKNTPEIHVVPPIDIQALSDITIVTRQAPNGPPPSLGDHGGNPKVQNGSTFLL